MTKSLREQASDLIVSYGGQPCFTDSALTSGERFILDAFLNKYPTEELQKQFIKNVDITNYGHPNVDNEESLIMEVIADKVGDLNTHYMSKLCLEMRSLMEVLKSRTPGEFMFSKEEAIAANSMRRYPDDDINFLDWIPASKLTNISYKKVVECLSKIDPDETHISGLLKYNKYYTNRFRNLMNASKIDETKQFLDECPLEGKEQIFSDAEDNSITGNKDNFEAYIKLRSFRLVKNIFFKRDSNSFLWDIKKDSPYTKVAQAFACWYACAVNKTPKYVKSKLGKYEPIVSMYHNDWDKVENILKNDLKELFDDWN